jgi:uncharacterized protein (DUF1499 family)
VNFYANSTGDRYKFFNQQKPLMFKSGLSCFLSLLLAFLCWLGAERPASAQPALTAEMTEIASGGIRLPLFSFSGQAPTNLGVKDGKLAPCPGTPNCVNSQTEATDQQHSIEPLAYTSTSTQALANLKSVIQDLPRTKIVTESGSYLYAEFTSALMGYVDDVEFYLDEAAHVIHVRSASRLGQSDLGVNRKRVEEIRQKFVQRESLS